MIGCPVSRREWILDHWFNHVEVALKVAEVNARFVFAGNPDTDPDTFQIINDRAPNATVIHVPEARREDQRDWNNSHRYRFMVEIRNLILEVVREAEPDYYFSLDSDILLHPDSIRSYLQSIHDAEAVGGKCYMSPMPKVDPARHPHAGRASPSYLMFSQNGNFKRTDIDTPGILNVDCIMAIKLMRPQAYNVDYEYHHWGEDVGWAKACREQGISFLWDARVINKHVMRREDLDAYDPRVGF